MFCGSCPFVVCVCVLWLLLSLLCFCSRVVDVGVDIV